MPVGVTRGDPEHLHFITLTVAIDYMRDADELWAASRQTLSDPHTRYLYDPLQVAQRDFSRVMSDMQRYRLSRKPEKDAKIWYDICQTLTRYFKGSVQGLLQEASMTRALLSDCCATLAIVFHTLKVKRSRRSGYECYRIAGRAPHPCTTTSSYSCGPSHCCGNGDDRLHT